MGSILNYLKIKPSPQSIDYVKNKKQFHLYTLLTEQRHPKTMTLSSSIRENTRNGLQMLLSVDDDISVKIEEISRNLIFPEQAVDAMCRAIRNRRKIYFYGCGATGRLAKQMESTFWRPFWKRIKDSPVWGKLQKTIPADIGDRLIGEMTGADRALISSLEGFEDLQIIGRLQLADRGIENGDVVICVAEGGETSSVIGAILAALEQYGELNDEKTGEASRNLYFVYNNPDNLLLSFDRSRAVIENPGITKLNLTTGPQAITGSTRMQAATSETFILGAILEEVIFRLLKECLTVRELSEIGFEPDINLSQRLLSFKGVRSAVDNSVNPLARLTELEAETYRNGHFSTYFAKKALTAVFIDCTERSPTFRLFPIDTVNLKERRSWIQVWTDAGNGPEAWRVILGRDFRGLDEAIYQAPFSTEIDDPYLREAAMKSLAYAGNGQEGLYDLSFSGFNKKSRGPRPGDLGVVLCIDEESSELNDPGSSFRQFCDFFKDNGGRLAVIHVNGGTNPALLPAINPDVTVDLLLPPFPDPLSLRSQIAVKMLLNAHSTGVMTLLGRVAGNTMTSVNPGNLKLIGRATFLIMLQVNDVTSRQEWIKRHGRREPVTFGDVNAVLFDAIEYVGTKTSGQTAEVALSIIRILEALKKETFVSWEEAQSILDEKGLEG
jgi:N-acetylmuramic acid 6-phosphate (MurNAc-6-P) etherase